MSNGAVHPWPQAGQRAPARPRAGGPPPPCARDDGRDLARRPTSRGRRVAACRARAAARGRRRRPRPATRRGPPRSACGTARRAPSSAPAARPRRPPRGRQSRRRASSSSSRSPHAGHVAAAVEPGPKLRSRSSSRRASPLAGRHPLRLRVVRPPAASRSSARSGSEPVRPRSQAASTSAADSSCTARYAAGSLKLGSVGSATS